MRISVGSDHLGYQLKGVLVPLLEQWGHKVTDEGPDHADYPDFASKVSEKVSAGTIDRGILICGSGIGMAITANKHPGVRATVADDDETAALCRRHNDVNVLCLSGNKLTSESARGIVQTWLGTEFEGGKHVPRLNKISAIEERATL